jgi:acyl carrier protein
LSLIGKRQTKR